MSATQLIGITASVFTATALLPQLVKVFKEKQADDVSLGMLVVLLGGLLLWIWYGLRKDDWIIIISNSFSILVNVALTILSIKYKERQG
jgi:MtN3 and saliva related transmembrane protein